MHGSKHTHMIYSNGTTSKYSPSIISPHSHIFFSIANIRLFRFYPGTILHKSNAIFWIFYMSSIPAYLFFNWLHSFIQTSTKTHDDLHLIMICIPLKYLPHHIHTPEISYITANLPSIWDFKFHY